MKKFFFDIETLPADQDKHELLKELYAKKKAKGRIKKTLEEFIETTNFGGAFGRIFCLCYAINDEPIKVLSGDEKEILKKFWEIAKEVDLFIGHNILEFDLKFIYQRSVILGIKPSREISFRKYQSSPVYDIMHEWDRWGGNYTPMDDLARAMGIPSSKTDLDGSKVHQYYKDGKHQEIIEYCCKDVEVTRKIYKRLNFEE
jgi:hypothetical protein